MDRQEIKIKRRQFSELLKQGKTAKEISLEIGVSEKTLSHWRNDLTQYDYLKLAKEVRGRLDKALKSQETTTTDIYKLTTSLSRLERLGK